MEISNFVKNIRNIMRGDAGINGDAQRIEQMAWMLFLKIYDQKELQWEFTDAHYRSIIPEELRWRNWAVDKKDGKAPTGEALLDFVNNHLFPTLKKLPVDENTETRRAIVRAVFEGENNYMKDGTLLRQVVNVIDEIDFGDFADRHAFGEIYETILKGLQSAGSSGEFYTPRPVTDFMVMMVKPKLGEKMADFAAGTCGFIVSTLKELEKQVKTVEDRKVLNESLFGIEKKPLPYLLGITNLLLHDIDNPALLHGNSLEQDVHNYTEKDRFHVILMNPPYGGGEQEGVKMNFPSDLRSSETADLFMSVILYRLKKNGRAAVILPDGFLFGTEGAKRAIKGKLMKECNLHTIIRMPSSVFAPYTSICTNILFFDKTGPTKETWFYRLDMPEGIKHFSKTKPILLQHFAPVIWWWNNRQPILEDGIDKARKFTIDEIKAGNYNLDLCGYPHEDEEILPPDEIIAEYKSIRTSVDKFVFETLDEILLELQGNEVFGDGQRTIPSVRKWWGIDEQLPDMLKRSVLQEAIQGRLVPQDPNDEPASELLKRIDAEHEKMVTEKKIKKVKPLPPIKDEDKPFPIPNSWEWVRLGEVSSLLSGRDLEQKEYSSLKKQYPYMTGASNFGEDGLIVNRWTDKPVTVSHKNDLLITCKGTIGAMAFNTIGDIHIARQIMAISSTWVDLKFVKVFLETALIALQSAANSMIPGISRETILHLAFPLPPLAEQKRIVAKVDSILAKIAEVKGSVC